MAFLPLYCLISEEMAGTRVPVVTKEAPWETLLAKGDATSLEKAKVLVMALKGEEAVDGLIALMKVGQVDLIDKLLEKADKATTIQKMKIAHYARISKNPGYVPILLDWATNSEDMLVRELAVRSLGDCGGKEVKERLQSLLKQGGLAPFVEAAVKASLDKLNNSDS